MKFLALATVALLFSVNASAFSRDEHKAITHLAAEWMNHCIEGRNARVRMPLMDSSIEAMADANAFEDINVAKKWTVAAHFYNPLKDFDWGKKSIVGVEFGRGDADDAVKRALGKIDYAHLDKRIGQMLHYIQDMSSPLHVIGVNHGLADGFENNTDIDAISAAKETKVNCARVRGDARHPLQLLRLNATATMKINDQAFSYRLGDEGRERQARWSDVFYVNKAISSEKLSGLLKRFDPLGSMFNLDRKDFPAGTMEKLPRGGYGAFAGGGGAISADNFGKTEFEVTADGGTLREVRIDRSQYLEYKKKLVLEAVQASMETISWGLMNQDGEGS